MDDALLAFEFDAREHLLRPHGAELQQHGQQPAEMREHLPRDRAALRLRSGGKRRAQVFDGEPAMAAIAHVERAAQHGAGGQHGADGKQAHEGDHADHGQILEPVPERGRRIRRGDARRAMLLSQR
jgi:hypothetical protein